LRLNHINPCTDGRPADLENQALVGRVFSSALRQHRAGDLERAEQGYREVLAAEPCHTDSLHLLGVVALQTGRHALALDLIAQALALAPQHAVYHINLGNTLLSLGRVEEATACYRQAVALDRASADAQIGLGGALRRLGRPEEAAAAFRDSLRLIPDDPRAHLGLGDALSDQQRLDEAERCYRAAVAAAPDDADAHNNLGSVLYRRRRLDESTAHLGQALTINPDHEEALFNLGCVLAERQDYQTAVTCLQRARALNPDRADTHNNLGGIHLLEDRAAESIPCFQAALRRRPDFAEAYSNLGVAQARLQLFEAAATAFRTALQLKPDYAEARNNLAMALLASGDMAAGWPLYESRWDVEPGLVTRPQFAQPQWMGEPGEGRTLLIYAEQAFGDTLQFCRYAPLVQQRGWRVVMAAPRPLIRLLSGLQGVDALFCPEDTVLPFDRQCAMLSLPLAVGTTVETIPATIPYLHADTAQATEWRARLAPADHAGLRIGLAWQGGRRTGLAITASVDRQRSLAPERLAPLLAVTGLQFFSLQKDGPRMPAGLPLHDHMEEMRDFADTAALVANMDLVISVDSAIAHLAGALGRPVWLLDRFGHCWRWLAGRRDSPWYPTMRIYRQPTPGDWGSVITEVTADLHQLADAWRAALSDSRITAPEHA